MTELSILAGVTIATFWVVSVVVFLAMLIHSMLTENDDDLL